MGAFIDLSIKKCYDSVICAESFCVTCRSVVNKKLPYQCYLSLNQYIRRFYKYLVKNRTTLEAVSTNHTAYIRSHQCNFNHFFNKNGNLTFMSLNLP